MKLTKCLKTCEITFRMLLNISFASVFAFFNLNFWLFLSLFTNEEKRVKNPWRRSLFLNRNLLWSIPYFQSFVLYNQPLNSCLLNITLYPIGSIYLKYQQHLESLIKEHQFPESFLLMEIDGKCALSPTGYRMCRK